MREQSIVCVGRKWHKPEIRVHVTKAKKDDPGGIHIEMEMDDFLKALAMEAGNPATLLTVAGLEARLRSAVDKVLAEMKFHSARAMQ